MRKVKSLPSPMVRVAGQHGISLRELPGYQVGASRGSAVYDHLLPLSFYYNSQSEHG